MNDSTSETTQTHPSPIAESKPAARLREEAIRSNVLAALGKPADLLRVSVVRLWGDNFRVNVWAGSPSAASIRDSFFVTADAEGSVLQTRPPMPTPVAQP
jgi:hypothetical protein